MICNCPAVSLQYELCGAPQAAAKGENTFCNYILSRDVSKKRAVSTLKLMERNSATVNMEPSCSFEKSELLILHSITKKPLEQNPP